MRRAAVLAVCLMASACGGGGSTRAFAESAGCRSAVTTADRMVVVMRSGYTTRDKFRSLLHRVQALRTRGSGTCTEPVMEPFTAGVGLLARSDQEFAACGGVAACDGGQPKADLDTGWYFVQQAVGLALREKAKRTPGGTAEQDPA
jgi:hypothetical protein